MIAMSWPDALAVIERDVALAERVLADDLELPAIAWSPPSDLGPLPPSLAPRARELVARAERVQAAVRTRMEALERDRAELDVRRAALTAYVTADQRAS